MRRPRGFTLAEVMIVMAIIGVLCGLMIGVLGRTYGASTRSVSEQLVSTMSLARLRATSTRRIHRVIVQSTQLSIWQATTSGLATPIAWQQVQIVKIPSGVEVWNAQAGALVSQGASPAQSATLAYPIDFRPDGRATASTVFVTDRAQSSFYRVLVYHASGGSYARQSW